MKVDLVMKNPMLLVPGGFNICGMVILTGVA